MTASELAWLVFGFGAQAVFFGRQIVQRVASERAGASVVPPAYWYLSLLGASMTLAYSLYRWDWVFIASTALTLENYARNVVLLRRKLT